jgi:hypothetical protein
LPNKEQRERLKRYLERVDDLVDPVVDLVELGDDALAFWEAYFWGRAACHLHMRVGKRGRRGTSNLCADFKVFRGMREIECIDFDAFSGTFFEMESGGGYKYGGCHPVFISVGEDSEDGESIPLRLASSVRLQALDDCPMRGEYILEGIGFCKLFRDDILDILVGFDNYRKSGSPRPAAGEFLPPRFHKRELPHEMVEHTSEIMHNISHEQARSDSWQLGGVGNLEDIVSRLRIELTGESYEVRWVQEEAVADFFIEDVAMYPRPCKLGLASTEVGSVSHG